MRKQKVIDLVFFQSTYNFVILNRNQVVNMLLKFVKNISNLIYETLAMNRFSQVVLYI